MAVPYPLLKKILPGIMLAVIFFIEIRKGYFKGSRDYLKTLALPVYRQSLAVLVLLTGGCLFADSFLRAFIQTPQYILFLKIAQTGEFLADYSWQILCAAYFLAVLFRLKKIREIIFSGLVSSFLTAAVITAFKYTLLRARPLTGMGPYSFFNGGGLFGGESVFHSFSSGDVALIAGFAFYFIYTSRHLGVKVFWLSLPVLSAFTRVYLDKHWPSDALFSMGLGWIAAKLVWDYRHGNSASDSRPEPIDFDRKKYPGNPA